MDRTSPAFRRVSTEEGRKLLGLPPAKSKYHAVPTVKAGIRFDSKAEALRWEFWQQQIRFGVVKFVLRQTPFHIQINDKPICKYLVDFQIFYANGSVEFEDVKSAATKKIQVFRIKLKAVEAVFPVKIRMVGWKNGSWIDL